MTPDACMSEYLKMIQLSTFISEERYSKNIRNNVIKIATILAVSLLPPPPPLPHTHKTLKLE